MNDDGDSPDDVPLGGIPRFRMDSSGGVTCATCGSSLGLTGPDGGCLNCLARFALSPGSDGTEGDESGLATHTFGHFEIVLGTNGWPEKLGRGAMGITYRARDTVLRTEVALKVIGGSVAGYPAARAAFLREARAAARLRHPNVASVFHYGEQDGQCFYAMELVEGETLEERVRRDGPLPPALVLEAARQVASALLEAEALGIVHRDLKPSNLMFVARRGDASNDPPHLKVIDFGLAQAADLAGAEETGGVPDFAGTPAFASPEQFARDRAQPVDSRSDIYSLGVTMWYLLCGRLPFGGDGLTEIRQQQTDGLPSVEPLRAAGMPGPVVDLLAAMMEIAPAARPQGARALLDALTACQDHLAVAPRAARRRRRFRQGLALVLAATLGLGGWLVWRRTRPLPPPPDRSLAVLPFENHSPDASNAFFATGVQDQITADLARIAQMKVVGGEGTRSYPPGRERNVPAICGELGVRHLLTGSLQREGERMRVAVTLTDGRDPAHPWTQEYDLRLPEVFAVQGEITRAVAERLQASLSPEEKAVINRPPTSSLEAYDLYLRANDKPSHPPESTQETREDAQRRIDLLDRAVALDPAFAKAYCLLAVQHDVIWEVREGSSPVELSFDHRALAEKCLARARALQPDLGETHLVTAVHLYVVNRDYEQAHEELEIARRTLPNDGHLETYAGRIARRQGRWEDALRSFRHAAELEPREPSMLVELIFIYHALRRYEEYDRAYAQVRALAPDDNDSVSEHARVALERWGDLGPWRAWIAGPPLGNPPEDIESLTVALYGGDPGEVDRALAASKEEVFRLGEGAYPRAWYTALAARMRGDEAAARTAFAAARPRVEEGVRRYPTAYRSLGLLALVDAGLGRKEDALREARRACELAPLESAALDAPIARCNLAAVYAWTGEADLAFTELNKLVELGYEGIGSPDQPSYGDFLRNPVWNPLRPDPRFDALVRRLAPPPTR